MFYYGREKKRETKKNGAFFYFFRIIVKWGLFLMWLKVKRVKRESLFQMRAFSFFLLLFWSGMRRSCLSLCSAGQVVSFKWEKFFRILLDLEKIDYGTKQICLFYFVFSAPDFCHLCHFLLHVNNKERKRKRKE